MSVVTGSPSVSGLWLTSAHNRHQQEAGGELESASRVLTILTPLPAEDGLAAIHMVPTPKAPAAFQQPHPSATGLSEFF